MRKVINLSESPGTATILFQFFISSAIVLGCLSVSTFLGLLIASLLTGQSFTSFAAIDWNHAGHSIVVGMEIVQVISQVGMFIVPALVLPWVLFKVSPFRYTGLSKRSSIVLFGLAFLVLYVLNPLLDLATVFNQKMQLPHFMEGLQQWMRTSEDTNGAITKRFLDMPNFGAFLFNAFLMALLPAFAEEIFFRGFIQRTVYIWWRNKHVAVIFTAAFFSFIHLQFFGFIPRMLLGMLLGYLFLWSGDLKVSMFVHFLNNFSIVLVAYIYQSQGKAFDTDSANVYPAVIYILSAAAGGLLLFAFYKNARKRKAEKDGAETLLMSEEPWAKIFSSANAYQAEIIAGNLRSEGFRAVVVNKRDSSYHTFGEAEVYVPETDAARAREILPSQE